MIRSRAVIVITLIAIFIWTIFAPPKNLRHFTMRLADTAGTPLKIISNSAGYIRKISRLPYFDSEKIELRRKILGLEKKLAESEEAGFENRRLRELLAFAQKDKRYSVPALVIGRDPNNWSSVVYIDKGSSDGIEEDMAVVSGQGLAGRVREPGKAMSKVMLINDVDSKVGAIIQKTRDQGLLVGTPFGECKLIYIPLDSDIKEGDMILTSGMGGVYPKGILIGRVKNVAKEQGRIYKYAIVEPSGKLSRLEEVLCIK